LTIVEIAPQILPRMIDRAGAEIVEAWLRKHGVEVRTSATLTAVEESGGKRRLRFKEGGDLDADVVIMATGIRTNLEWVAGSGIRVNRGVVVDDHLRSSVPNAEVVVAHRPDRQAYRKILWRGERLVGAMICGLADDVWTTNDVGMLKGLVQTGIPLGPWKAHLRRNPFDVKPVFVASRATARLLPETVIGRPSEAPAVVWT